jgi:hypothetical protein
MAPQRIPRPAAVQVGTLFWADTELWGPTHVFRVVELVDLTNEVRIRWGAGVIRLEWFDCFRVIDPTGDPNVG